MDEPTAATESLVEDAPRAESACGDAACSGDACAEEAEQREPCPTPLSWQQVLGHFVAERERHEVTVDGHRFVAWTWGDAAAPPVFLLGGLTATPETYSLLAHLLREDHRVVIVDDPAVDERGPRRRSLGSFAADVVATADALGVERFTPVAVGWGTTVALRTMLDAPNRVDRAVLVSGYARLKLSFAERTSFRLARWWPGSLGGVPMQRTMTEQNHRRWFPPFDQSRWDFFATETSRVPLRVIGARASSVLNEDLVPRLGEIAHPVLLVRGEGEGRMAIARQEELVAGLPNARTEWMHSTGQLSFLTHPHRLVKLVRTFRSESPEGAAASRIQEGRLSSP